MGNSIHKTLRPVCCENNTFLWKTGLVTKGKPERDFMGVGDSLS